MRAALYARVSTDKQSEKYGIPSQIEALRKRCQERAWTPVFDGDKDVFIDDGVSGAELDRPALNRLRQAARDGKVDVVLSYDPDRLSRKLYHQMILAEEFEKQGIKLQFITHDMGTSPEDRMFFNMRGLVAEYEREKIRERTIRGSREKARQGKIVNGGSVALGFRYNKEKAALEEDPERAQTLRLIFYAFAKENLSLQGLAAKLNRLRVATPRGGDRWRASTLGAILRNEVYIGKMYHFRQYRVHPESKRKPSTLTKKTATGLRPKEEWIAVSVPSLVLLEIFKIVQRKLKSNRELSRRNTKREYLLSGLLRCSKCNGRMGGHNTRGILHYHCHRRGHPDRVPLGPDGRPQPCSCPEVKAQTIEPVVWDTIGELTRNPDFLIEQVNRRNDGNSQTRDTLERELQLCRARLKAMPEEQRRLVEGYRKGLYADSMMREEMEVIQKEQAELERQKAELERELAQVQITQSQEAQIRSLVERIGVGSDKVDFSGKQEVLRLLVEKIVYNGRSVEITTVIPPAQQLHLIHRGGLRGG